MHAETAYLMHHEERFFEDGQLIKRTDIPLLVKEMREQKGLSTAHIARDLGVPEPSITQAEAQPHRALFKLRKRILERFTGYTLDGPFYRVRRKTAA